MSNKITLQVVANGVDETNKRLGTLHKTVGAIDKTQKNLGLGWAKTAVALAVASKGIKMLTSGLQKLSRATLTVAAKYEVQRKAFGNLLQDVQKGTVLFEQLKRFAASTPLQLDDITRGTQKLLAFGVANEDVIGTMKRLGDLSMGQSGKLVRLTNAYGRLKAKGKATLEEINMFTENGVPLMDALAKSLGTTTQNVFALVNRGEIQFDDVQKAIQSLTGDGGQFFGMMEDASLTLTGKWSTYKDVMAELGGTLGDVVLPHAKGLLDVAIETTKEFTENIKLSKMIKELTRGDAEQRPDEANLTLAIDKNKEELLARAKQLHGTFTFLKNQMPEGAPIAIEASDTYLTLQPHLERLEEENKQLEHIRNMSDDEYRKGWLKKEVVEKQVALQTYEQQIAQLKTLKAEEKELSASDTTDKILTLSFDFQINAAEIDKQAVQQEIEQHTAEIQKIADTTSTDVEMTQKAKDARDAYNQALAQTSIVYGNTDAAKYEKVINDLLAQRTAILSLHEKAKSAGKTLTAEQVKQQRVALDYLSEQITLQQSNTKEMKAFKDVQKTINDLYNNTEQGKKEAAINELLEQRAAVLGYVAQAKDAGVRIASDELEKQEAVLKVINKQIDALNNKPAGAGTMTADEHKRLYDSTKAGRIVAAQNQLNAAKAYGVDLTGKELEQNKEVIASLEKQLELLQKVTTEREKAHEKLTAMAATVRASFRGADTSGVGVPDLMSGLGDMGGGALDALAAAKLPEGDKDRTKDMIAGWGAATQAAVNYADTIGSYVMKAEEQHAQQVAAGFERSIGLLRDEKEYAIAIAEEQGMSKALVIEGYNEKIAELEDKKLQEQHKFSVQKFNYEKGMAITQAIIAGALGVANAWASGNIPYAIVASAIIAGVTGAQIGLIASQPPPALASGGIVPAQHGGGLYTLGEAGRAETVLPFDVRDYFMRTRDRATVPQVVVHIMGDVYGIDDLAQKVTTAIQKKRYLDALEDDAA